MGMVNEIFQLINLDPYLPLFLKYDYTEISGKVKTYAEIS
jgi:hypothetical protein